jgi:RimJ/RimL family protein N-acetyltransferase
MKTVVLRDVSERDISIFFEHQIDPDACAMAAFNPRSRDDFAQHWVAIRQDDAIDKKTILFGDHVAGYVVCFERRGIRQVGYWIGKTFWGRGIATLAVTDFLGAIDERPLYAYVAKNNLGSLRVLEKCGFTIHGEGMTPAKEGDPEVEEFILILR